jgi:hypothetical protein
MGYTMEDFGPLVQRFLLEHPGWKPSIDSHCPVGWDPILGRALVDLHELARSRRVRISISQIKEKFAELRIYFSVAGEPEQFQFDIIGGNRRTSGRGPRAPADSVRAEAMVIVNRASEESRKACQSCGRPGSVRSGGWLRVYCDEHVPPENPD